MIPLEHNSMEVEFTDICKYIDTVTHCSAFNNKNLTSSIKKGIQEVLRIFGHKFKPTRISEEAFSSCENEIKNKLSDSNFYKEWYRERERHYPLFFEHIVPLGSIIERCKNCTSIEEIEDALSELEFVIILKKENDVLKNNGFSSKGRETLTKAEKVYKECNIVLKTIKKKLYKKIMEYGVTAHNEVVEKAFFRDLVGL